MKVKLNKTKKCNECKHFIGWMNINQPNESPCCELSIIQNDTEWITEDCPNFSLILGEEQ